MIVKFKCKASGNVFSYENAHDIKTMRAHPEYDEVVEEQVVFEDSAKKAERSASRPKKVYTGEEYAS